MSEKIGILVDSTADFPEGLVQALNIHIAPVHIIVDGEDYIHGKTITNHTVIKHLKNHCNVYTTPPTSAEYADIYEDLLIRYETVVSLHISNDLSGCLRNARSALNHLFEDEAERIQFYDLKSVSIAQGVVAKNIIRSINQTTDVDDIQNIVAKYTENIFMSFVVEDTIWLKRGGRVSALASFLGNMLNVKPIINLDAGQLKPFENHRGKESALKRLVELVAGANIFYDGKVEIWVAYADNLGEAQRFREMIAAKLGRTREEIILVEIGATISVHVGPGSLCVAMVPS